MPAWVGLLILNPGDMFFEDDLLVGDTRPGGRLRNLRLSPTWLIDLLQPLWLASSDLFGRLEQLMHLWLSGGVGSFAFKFLVLIFARSFVPYLGGGSRLLLKDVVDIFFMCLLEATESFSKPMSLLLFFNSSCFFELFLELFLSASVKTISCSVFSLSEPCVISRLTFDYVRLFCSSWSERFESS